MRNHARAIKSLKETELTSKQVDRLARKVLEGRQIFCRGREPSGTRIHMPCLRPRFWPPGRPIPGPKTNTEIEYHEPSADADGKEWVATAWLSGGISSMRHGKRFATRIIAWMTFVHDRAHSFSSQVWRFYRGGRGNLSARACRIGLTGRPPVVSRWLILQRPMLP